MLRHSLKSLSLCSSWNLLRLYKPLKPSFRALSPRSLHKSHQEPTITFAPSIKVLQKGSTPSLPLVAFIFCPLNRTTDLLQVRPWCTWAISWLSNIQTRNSCLLIPLSFSECTISPSEFPNLNRKIHVVSLALPWVFDHTLGSGGRLCEVRGVFSFSDWLLGWFVDLKISQWLTAYWHCLAHFCSMRNRLSAQDLVWYLFGSLADG